MKDVHRRVSLATDRRISLSVDSRSSVASHVSMGSNTRVDYNLDTRPSVTSHEVTRGSPRKVSIADVNTLNIQNGEHDHERVTCRETVHFYDVDTVTQYEEYKSTTSRIQTWLQVSSFGGMSRGHWATCASIILGVCLWMIVIYSVRGFATHDVQGFGKLRALSLEHPYDYLLDMNHPLNHVEYHVKLERTAYSEKENGHRRRRPTSHLIERMTRMILEGQQRVGVDDARLSLTVEIVRMDDGVWTSLPQTNETKTAIGENGEIVMIEAIDLTSEVDAEALAVRVHTNTPEPTPMIMKLYQSGEFGWCQVWVAGLTLILMYVLIVFEIVHRTTAALVGMAVTLIWLAILGKTPSVEEAFGWLEQGVLILLFGMMIIVHIVSQTGVFEWMAIQAYMLCRNKLWLLMVILATVTGVLSAFLDNVTTMLLTAPVTIRLANILNIDPRPLLICECIMSNIGGAATMIGDPPNIIIGQALSDHIGFVDFLVDMLPGVIIISPFSMGFLAFLFRQELQGKAFIYNLSRIVKDYQITDKPLLVRVSIVFTVVLILFLTEPIHHVDVAWVACIGAIVMLLISDPANAEDALRNVEWDTLVFFSALFIMIRGLSEMGLISWIGDMIGRAIGAAPAESQMTVAIVILIWVSGVVSAFLDNIPFTTTMVPVVLALANNEDLNLELEPMAWALAFGACLGGNGTIIGASANLVTAAVAMRDKSEITFIAWFKIGFPTMLISLTVATFYCLLRYVWLA
eukprot:CFRG4083T1